MFLKPNEYLAKEIALEIISNINSTIEFPYLEIKEYEKILFDDPREGTRVYWSEIFSRFYIGSILALIRSVRWLDFIENSIKTSNFIGYATGLRGLLEASCDNFDSFVNLPKTFAKNHHLIQLSLAKETDTLLFSASIEENLIHFTYARKIEKNELAPDSHYAKTMKQYIEKVDKMANGPTYKLYGQLCQITHPAAYSMTWALQLSYSDRADSMRITPYTDSFHINSSLKENESTISKIIENALNLPLISLKALNLFSLKETRTPSLDNVDMSEVPFWQEVWDTFLKHKP